MELKREVSFGKAIAEITIISKEEERNLDGMVMGTKTVISQNVVIKFNGKKITSDNGCAIVNGDNSYFADKIKKAGNPDFITMVGDAVTAGRETGDKIKQAIAEMIEELTGEKEESKEEKKTQVAKEIVGIAEEQGVENLMTEDQIKVWRENYNNIMNEGGDGYIPQKISKEQHQRALKILNR